MAPTQSVILKKSLVGEFLGALNRGYEVFLPAKVDESVQYVTYKPGTAPDFSAQPVFPLKEVFFTKWEVLMTWNGEKIASPKIGGKPKALFGLRRCDLNAISKQDIAFSTDFDDTYYKRRREGALLIGYHCDDAPTENCFCYSLPKKDFFDIMLYDRGKHFMVEIGSEEGEKIVKKHEKLFAGSKQPITDDDRKIRGLRKLDYSAIKGSDGHKAWDACVEKCLSCSACTAWCPTCYCHEIHDEVNPLDVSSGERLRTWSSCQLKSFTRVAGDMVFRNGRRDRYLHRVMHQLLYFEEKNGQPLCVGCGRCITHCPTRIDFISALNDVSSAGGGMR